MDEGGRWIFVGRAKAQAHPQYKLGLGLWLSALYFTVLAAVGLVNGRLIFGSDMSLLLYLIPLINLITAVAIVMRWPFAHPLVMLLVGVLIGGMFLFGRFSPEPYPLAVVVCGLAVGLYFFEGGRPNLIYRHRYYSRKPREDGDV